MVDGFLWLSITDAPQDTAINADGVFRTGIQCRV
jgi:hypothetical protein